MTTPSWQPDPMGRHELRWWDGQRWTEHVSDGGATSADPMPAPPPSSPPIPTAPPAGAQWAAPTAPSPAVPGAPTVSGPTQQLPAVPPTGPTGRRRTPLLVGAAVAVLAVGVGAGIVIISGDDGESQVVSTTAAPDESTETTATESVDTTEPTQTTEPRTDPAGVDELLAALPGVADVPSDWVLNYEASTEVEPASGPGYGYCGGGNAAARALEIGDPTIVYGAEWLLPDGSTFGAALMVFGTDDEAQQFLDGTHEQANACAESPVSFTAPESELDWFEDGYGDDTDWTVLSLSTAVIGSALQSDAEVRGYVDDIYSATVVADFYSVSYSSITVYERHGRTVVLFSADGSWDFSGFTSTPEWAHRPDDVELDRSIADYRSMIVSRLEEIGAL